MNALIDTNVIIDVLQQREPWFNDGAAIFEAIANRQINGFVTSKQIADIHFFSRKQFKGQENVDVKARSIIEKLLSLFSLVDTLGADCQNALAIINGDYEDAIMMKSAMRAGMDCIVMRNIDHFSLSTIPVYTPADFIAEISGADKNTERGSE